MVKGYLQKRKFRKTCIAALCCVTVTCTGLAAACSTTSDDDDAVTYPKGEDTQLLKNGSFEYFSIPDDAVYLIKSPDSWSRAGSTSVAMSGVISTAAKSWDALTASDLKDKLDYNNDLDSDDDNYEDEYVDYNGMTSKDILYRDTYSALLDADDVADSYIKNQGYEKYFGITKSNDKYYLADGTEVYYNDDVDPDYYLDSDYTIPVRQALIANPETHYDITYDADGVTPESFKDGNGKDVALYVDETTGDYYYLADGVTNDEADEDDKTYISNVLMIHNADSKHNGISQYYGSSTTITLEANTAAEISLWVKTSDLRFDKGYSQLTDEGRGAYIEVVQTVGGSTIDSFKITAINTEKIIADNDDVENSNGWLQYTVYVNACDFASSTVTLNLGLGGSSTTEYVSGYAFFDDVSVTQYIDISDENCTYSAHKDETVACTLTSSDEEKIFIADKEVRSGNANRYSKNFYYLIDLASETIGAINTYEAVTLGASYVTAGLTTEESGNKVYTSSTDDNAKYNSVTVKGLDGTEILPKNLNDPLKTGNDLIGVYNSDYTFDESDFNGTNYSKKLNDALTGISSLPKFKTSSSTNMLVMLSANGAAYTSTVSDPAFTLASEEYMIVSFWVKTYDMNGKTAATLKVYDKYDKDVSSSFSIDSTDITTDVGDEEDIYNGWVQCFFFVQNDTDEEKTFNIDFSFGNTSLADTTIPSYNYGWIALANMQTLKIDETVYGLVSTGDYAVSLSLSETTSNSNGNVFDNATGTSNIKEEISVPSNYNGVNGGSSYVTDNDYMQNYDSQNTNAYAGLINSDYFENYSEDLQKMIASAFNVSFTDAVSLWSEVFGSNSYQPLIIVNNLRTYADLATATEATYNGYYVLAEDDYTGDVIETTDGKRYRKVNSDDEYSDDTDYYTLNEVLNYGYIGATSSVSSDSYSAISVKVKVSEGATAYIYLVDSETRKILGYTTPEYSFWYDDEGNVLDCEYDDTWSDKELRSHIVYTLRDDGLYEDGDGKLFANLYNLTKVYNHYQFEHDSFYDKDGNRIAYDNLVEGETYYRDETLTTLAEHFLCATDGTRVYEYYIDETTNKGAYYYLVDDTYTNDDGDEVAIKVRGEAVESFDTQYCRDYTPITAESALYYAVVSDTNGEWVTVNFIIHAGSEAISYRLEVWSGARDKTGLENDSDNLKGGMVAFDYSAYSVSSSNFDSLLSEYENKIIKQYNSILESEGLLEEVKSNTENIAYYEELFDTLNLSADAKAKIEDIQKDYKALYYTYTLYDAENYVPFNADTADEGETGYEYKQSDYSETLAYFSYNVYDSEGKVVSYNIFADYSAVDNDIAIGTNSDDTTDDDDTDSDSNTSIWLLASSIILVVALLITMISLLIRSIVKKHRRKRSTKAQSKNMYRKRERYIKRLHLERNEESTDDSSESTDAKEVPAEETTESATEENAVEETEEKPVDGTETPSDDDGIE